MDKPIGQIAFEAYNKAKGGKTFDGRPIPPWGEVGAEVQAGWEAAADAVADVILADEEDDEPAYDPFIGAGVHYVTSEGAHLPAVVVRVWAERNGAVDLVIFDTGDTPVSTADVVDYDPSPDHVAGTWHWAEVFGI
jgi:hypothetical protein